MRDWVYRARCASDEVDSRDFQVVLRGDNQNKAKLVCMECPVQPQCLRWALEHGEIWGVWGGLDEGELRRVLSVDSVGRYVRRCRSPGCPNPRCRARPSSLEIVGAGKDVSLRCQVCGFAWRSPTSVAAVRFYLKDRLQIERRQARLRAKALSGHVPLETPMATVVPISSGTRTRLPLTVVPTALVATSGPDG